MAERTKPPPPSHSNMRIPSVQRRSPWKKLIAILLVGFVVCVGICVVVPAMFQAGIKMKCQAHCKDVAAGLSYYVSEPVNQGFWPWMNGTNWDSPTGTNLHKPPPASMAEPDSRSVTSLPFLLVSQNAANIKMFACPLDATVTAQPDVVLETNGGQQQEYDFRGSEYVSYSYIAPLFHRHTKWQSGAGKDCVKPESVPVLSDANPMREGKPVGPWADDMTSSQRRDRLSSNHEPIWPLRNKDINVVWMDFHVNTETRADIGVQRDNIYSAGGSDEKTWRQSVSTKLTDHTNMRDSFLIGPYGK